MRNLEELLTELDVASTSEVRVDWKLADSRGERTRPIPPGAAVAISPTVEFLISGDEAALLVRAGASIVNDDPAWAEDAPPPEHALN